MTAASATPLTSRILRLAATPSTRFQVVPRGTSWIVRDMEHALYFSGSWSSRAGAAAYAAHRNEREDQILAAWAERSLAAITAKCAGMVK